MAKLTDRRDELCEEVICTEEVLRERCSSDEEAVEVVLRVLAKFDGWQHHPILAGIDEKARHEMVLAILNHEIAINIDLGKKHAAELAHLKAELKN